MDDLYPTVLIVAAGIIVFFRLLNNLLKAGYFSLGRISLLALAEREREQNTRLSHYLDQPPKLNLCAQIFDRIALVLLFLTLIQLNPVIGLKHVVWFLLYLAVFDFFAPFALSIRFPEALVIRLFPVMRIPYLAINPIWLLMSGLARGKKEGLAEEEAPEDVKAFLQAGTEEGIIEEKEKPLLHNLITFNDTVVREVMTPRTDMVCIDINASKQEVLDVFKQTKYSRLPVFRGDIDHIEGVLKFKDMLDIMGSEKGIESFISEILFVPERKNISDQLQEMLQQRLQMAIVIDEFGGTAGLVTLEDLIEEIVGEIHDEHETPESDEIIDLENGSFLVDGKVLLEDFCELFSIDVTDDDVDTIGGFIFNREGRIPKEGDICYIGDMKVEIAKADDRRIYQVKVTPEEDPAPAKAED